MKKIHLLFFLTILVIVGLSYIGGYWQVSSFFTDIRDIEEVTNCQKPTTDECEMPVPQLAWYFAKYPLYMLLPSTLIAWLFVTLGFRKMLRLWLPLFPLIGVIITPICFAIARGDVDFEHSLRIIGGSLLMYAIPILIIGGLHLRIKTDLEKCV